jgi:polyisoprenoid-binding protein YceI
MLRCLCLLAGLLALPLPAAAAPWKLEPATTVAVDVTWQGRVVTVRFPELDGRIDFDAARPEQAKAAITVAAGAATTGVPIVDRLVRSRDYLDAADYPSIGFRLDRLTQTSKQTAEVAGRITLRGVTKPVAFEATVTRYGPAADDPKRFEAAFDLTGSIDRTEFGSTGGLPEVAAVLPVRIHLSMASE